MMVLGIETSCDETAAAIVTESGQVLGSCVASQLDVHAPFGGVVPELASRQHLRDLPRVVEKALQQSGLGWDRLDGIAATYGPGLVGALLVGLGWAKAAAWARNLPFIGVHHLEGHLAALTLEHANLPSPLLGLVASGGHTSLYLIEHARRPPHYQLISETRDDAVGEAFDKVAKLLGLPYPGGPAIEAAAESLQPTWRFPLPRNKDGSNDFSYSGLKTAVRYYVEEKRKQQQPIQAAEVAAAFQLTVIDDLLRKTLLAAQEQKATAVALVGGVAANKKLRSALAAACSQRGLAFYTPSIRWCTDNAAMIAVAGVWHLQAGERSAWDLDAHSTVELA
jgi:N6-L-threonylcarbamoyladenine synthase